MLRILEMSDLHLEFGRVSRINPLPDPSTYDVVMLPGDIGMGCQGIMWAIENVPADKVVVYSNGNHEYYKNDFLLVQEQQKALIARYPDRKIYLLNPGVVVLDNVVIIGCTLWTDLELKGHYDHRATDMFFERSIGDFQVIRYGSERWSVEKHKDHHRMDRQFLYDMVALFQDRGHKIVVMTHFVPSQLCIDPIYQNDPLNPYFTVDMDDLMLDYKIDAWFFGHTHSKMIVEHPSGTKLICNPAGYPGENGQAEWGIHSF